MVLLLIIAIASGGDESPSGTTVAEAGGTTTPETATTSDVDSPGTTTPITTAAPATTAPSDTGTRENPIPPGTTAQVGDYEVTVTSFQGDATQIVLDENQFNEPPPEGSVYSLIGLSLTYVGTETGTPWVDLSWSGIGASNVAAPSECPVIPNDIFDVPELFPEGAAEANICLTVLSTDLDSLVLILENTFSLDSRSFFGLPR